MERDIEVEDIILERAGDDAGFAISYALLRLADAQSATATWIKYLGTGDAATTMGAIELHSLSVERVAKALEEIASELGACTRTRLCRSWSIEDVTAIDLSARRVPDSC